MSSKTPKVKEKRLFYTEHAYFFGILLSALASALMVTAGFGVTFVDAPAYILYLKAAVTSSSFTFGTAIYTFSAFILLFQIFWIAKPNKSYLFSFLSTVIYAFVVDAMSMIFGLIPINTLWFRILLLLFAIIIGPLGVVLLRHTYITSVAYDFFVVNMAKKLNKGNEVVKTIYWLLSALLATSLSFYFFGRWEFIGIGIGSLAYGVCYIFLFKFWDKSIENNFHFRDNYKSIKRHFK